MVNVKKSNKRARTKSDASYKTASASSLKKTGQVFQAAPGQKTNKTHDIQNCYLIPSQSAVVSPAASPWWFTGGSTIAGSAPTLAVSSVCLNSGITSGGGGGISRNDKHIYMSAVSLKGRISKNSATTFSGTFQMRLYYMKDLNGVATIPLGSYFANNTHGNAGQPLPFSHSNTTNVDNFRLIKTWTWNFDPDAGGDDSQFTFDDYVQLKGAKASYEVANTDGRFNSMTEGGLILTTSFCTNSFDVDKPYNVGGLTNTPVLALDSRLYFS